MTVYLRKMTAGKPIDYRESLEKQGLVTFPRKYLAIYTCSKGRGETGPQGPTGATGATGAANTVETIICSLSDQITALTADAVTPVNTFRAPFAMDLTNGEVRINVNTAPTGSTIIVDLHMNGATIFSTLLTIDINEKTSVTAAVPAVLSVTDIPDDAEFEAFITQVGSSVAGTGLKITVTGNKVA